MTIHIYTGREMDVAYFNPWQWHKALLEDKCPHCGEKPWLQMLESGHDYVCIACHRVWAMPVLGFGPQNIFCLERTAKDSLQFLRMRAYQIAWDRLDDYGRDIGNGWNGTGRFTKRPNIRSFAHLGWQKAKQLAGKS